MSQPEGRGRALDDRLAAAGVDPAADPFEAWPRLRAAEGRRATVIDLYELVARRRGLAGHELPIEERRELSTWAMPFIWPGFTRTTASERSDFDLAVVAYDATWPDRYAEWEHRLRTELGAAATRIEHVGSTAVPGLAAKPTLDVQVSVVELADEVSYVAPIERTGLHLRSRDVFHRFFRPRAGQPREVHVHVCGAGSEWEREHLLFRDYLRAHPAAADAYAALKWDAARRWEDDRIAYTEAKSAVVLDLLAAAESWSAATSWSPGPPSPRRGPERGT